MNSYCSPHWVLLGLVVSPLVSSCCTVTRQITHLENNTITLFRWRRHSSHIPFMQASQHNLKSIQQHEFELVSSYPATTSHYPRQPPGRSLSPLYSAGGSQQCSSTIFCICWASQYSEQGLGSRNTWIQIVTAYVTLDKLFSLSSTFLHLKHVNNKSICICCCEA